ncbi:MAG TPA: ester cyclase, partial [Candidatus Limnocylindria bacterium]
VQKEVVFSRFVEEIFHRGNLAALDQIFTPEALIHDPGVELRGLEALGPAIRGFRKAFPDLKITVEDQIAEGDRLAIRYRGEGTHRDEWHGIPARGARISYTGILIVRFEGDRIAEYWAQPDLLGLMQQLGAVPTSEPMTSGAA